MPDQSSDDTADQATNDCTNGGERPRDCRTDGGAAFGSECCAAPRTKPREGSLRSSSRNLVFLAPFGVLLGIGLVGVIGGDAAIDNGSRHTGKLPNFSGVPSYLACPCWFQPVRARRVVLPL